jgi:hypothetical protein
MRRTGRRSAATAWWSCWGAAAWPEDVGRGVAPSRTISSSNDRDPGDLVAGLLGIVNYGEHGRTFPTSAPTPVLIDYLIP